MDRNYNELVQGIDHTRARQQNELSTIIAQYTIVVVEALKAGVLPNQALPFSDRLAQIHQRWLSVVLFKAGASPATNWAVPSEDPEYRFQALVSRMISAFIADCDSIVAPDFFSKLYMPRDHGQSQEMLQKFSLYTYYLRRLKTKTPRTEEFYNDAEVCLVVATQLGAYMDATL